MTLTHRVNILFERFPYTTQSLIAGVLQVAGDVIAQKFVEKKRNIDKRRCMNALILGCFTGIVLRKWYGIMIKRFRNPQPVVNAVSKVAGKIF